MSLNLELIKSKSTIETVTIAIVSFILSLLSVLVLTYVFEAMGYPINRSQLIKYGLFDVLSNRKNIYGLLAFATPLIFTGLAVAIAFQAGLFNIGGQGQMAMGACYGAIWAAVIGPQILPDFMVKSAFVMILSTMIIGFIGGAIWGFIPGVLKAKTGAHEVITTIMMNFVASAWIRYLVGSQTYSPYVDKTSINANSQTDIITPAAQLHPLTSYSTKFTVAFFIAIIVIFIIHFLMSSTTFGYRIRAVGFNSKAATSAGINVDRMTILSMTLSGGLAGLGGVLYVMSVSPYRYYIGGEGTIGFDGIAVALIAQNAALAIGVAAIFFGFLYQSANNIDFKTDQRPEIIYVVQAFVILFVAAPVIARSLIRAFRVDREAHAELKRIANESIDNSERMDANIKEAEK